jgi:S-adenosylmethionine:tRNA ribosyltransferase-isomerase
MLVRDFAFDLPPELIAQRPAADRGAARLLVLSRATGAISHGTVADLPARLTPGDLIVVNNTRVFPARLLGRRVPSGGAVECLLVRRTSADAVLDEVWEALVHPGQKLKPGGRVVFEGEGATLRGEILEQRFFGRRLIRLWTTDGSAVGDVVDRIGHIPLPPYIKRHDEIADRDRYQTVFAQERGSIAAPTAGLHFTPALIDVLLARGIEIAEITLHVGYGTFQPVRVDRVEDHHLEAERFAISDAAGARVNRALAEGRRVIAVGTTTTRALEAAAAAGGGRVPAGSGSTDLFIYPGFEFRIVSGLLTNFHLPHSSLLMLVCAFAGREPVLAAYREAIATRYRFYSYGDAMLIA